MAIFIQVAEPSIDLFTIHDKYISVRPEPVEGLKGFDKLSPNGVLKYGTLNNA